MTQPSNERWQPVPGYEGRYEVSDHGRVRGLDRMVRSKADGTRFHRGKPLSPDVAKSGHLAVCLYKEGKAKRVFVHVLVLEAFVKPRPSGMVTCHNDSNPQNNYVGNLRWDTQAENIRDTSRAGRHHHQLKTHCPQGHSYSESNVYVMPSRPNARYCRECNRIRSKERRARRSAARAKQRED